jgi:TIR domain-containing protein
MVPLPNEVFLSHSSLDGPITGRIADVLRAHGIPVWYSQTNLIGAQQWHDEIGAALKRCDCLAVVLSPNSVNSAWVKREVLYSLTDHRYDERIVPLLLEPCDYDQLSWTLPSLQLVDFTAGFEDGCRSLLRVWGLGYKA